MQGRYSFWIRVLYCLVVGLAVSSYFIPLGDKVGEWLPLLGGFADFSAFNENLLLRGVLGGIFNVLIALSLLAINTKSVHNVFLPNFTVAFFLVIALLNPSAVYFSTIHPAVLLMVWGQYCFISSQKFTSMFLLSCAALFYAPLLLALPFVLIISVLGAADILRVTLKSLGGLILPFVYLLSFRYMAYADAMVFIDEYVQKAIDFSSPLYRVSFTSLFLVLCIGSVLIHSLSNVFRKLFRNSIITEHILKMELMCMLLGGAMFFMFWGNGDVPVNIIVALPLSMLFSFHFTGNITAAPARIEFILLCCAAVISRLYYFI